MSKQDESREWSLFNLIVSIIIIISATSFMFYSFYKKGDLKPYKKRIECKEVIITKKAIRCVAI